MLAFENSNVENYVTEKFYPALLAGAVPVVMGAPNVWAFAPSNASYIDVRDFADAAALAAHLRQVAADDDAWLAYHRWRDEPLQPHFAALPHESMNTLPCRVCRAVHDWHNNAAERSELK